MQAIAQQQAQKPKSDSQQATDEQPAAARAAGTYTAPEWDGAPQGYALSYYGS